MATEQDAQSAQDALRPIRNFVALLGGAVSDQMWAGYDSQAVGSTGQFYSQGPTGVAVEGKPLLQATIGPQGQTRVKADPLIVIGGLILLYVFLK